jgi:hypothetical protein
MTEATERDRLVSKKTAQTPPMGWNSWDVYGASVREEEVLGNAEYMARHLKPYGWEYVVVDIQWYEPGANSSTYRPFVPLEMDSYSRLLPAVNRFPSAAGGMGFKRVQAAGRSDPYAGTEVRHPYYAGHPPTSGPPEHADPWNYSSRQRYCSSQFHLSVEYRYVWCGPCHRRGTVLLRIIV